VLLEICDCEAEDAGAAEGQQEELHFVKEAPL
jgi:hypothetical protein